jgi:hypothetical protein
VTCHGVDRDLTGYVAAALAAHAVGDDQHHARRLPGKPAASRWAGVMHHHRALQRRDQECVLVGRAHPADVGQPRDVERSPRRSCGAGTATGLLRLVLYLHDSIVTQQARQQRKSWRNGSYNPSLTPTRQPRGRGAMPRCPQNGDEPLFDRFANAEAREATSCGHEPCCLEGMSQPRSAQRPNPPSADVHPETRKKRKAAGPPDEKSSKAAAHGADARNADDKDGNDAQQPAPNEKR